MIYYGFYAIFSNLHKDERNSVSFLSLGFLLQTLITYNI